MTAAYLYGEFHWEIAVFTLLTALFLQVLSNLANDYGDSIHGADNAERKGPKRAVQEGVITAAQMKKAVIFCSILALISGITLLFFSYPVIGMKSIIVLFAAGLLAIAAAVLYTNGKRPYGYAGLGDISVFLFFGWLAVMGSAFLQSGEWNLELLLPATAFGFLSVGVLNVNNMRDIHSDQLAGKKSIPVRIGLKAAKTYHYLLVNGAVLLILLFFLRHQLSPFFMVLPVLAFVLHLSKIRSAETEEEFDPQLKVLSLSSFLTCLSFIAAIAFGA